MYRKNAIHWMVLIVLIVGACTQATPAPVPTRPIPTSTAIPTPTPLFDTPFIEQTFPSTSEISYASSADWLTELPAEDRQDQIRDWAMYGLIGLLDLDVETIRDIGYDQTAVRDGLFFGMANPTVGPGRGFFDGQETLHILVPAADLYVDRTIALVLDEHRKNAGNDPAQVVIHHYQIDEASQKVQIQSDTSQPAAGVRASHGYIELPVNTLTDLESFLASTDHLSQIRVIDDQIWAAGWHWSNVPVGQISLQDISALSAGYSNSLTNDYTVQDQTALRKSFDEQVSSGLLDWPSANRLFEIEDRNRGAASTEPGFSLDPGVVLPRSDALNLLASSGKYPVLTSDIDNLQRAFQAWTSAVSVEERQNAAQGLLERYFYLYDREAESANLVWSLFDGRAILEITITTYPSIAPYVIDLRTQFDQLYEINLLFSGRPQAQDAILQLASSIETFEPEAAALIRDAVGQRARSVYQVARYDGGMQGTEAAMTYFYTDLVAKAWDFNLGEGVPFQVVDGFIPSPLFETPSGFCPSKASAGRLWFGLRSEGLDIRQRQISFGGLATRVFTLVESESGGEEVEPEYSLGRIIWWWDRHYNAMADYEPQYHRLDQLNRWGAALAWLKGNPNLPQLPSLDASQVARDMQFGRWLNEHASELRWRYNIPFVQPAGETTEALLTLYSDIYEECGTTWRFSGGISAPGIDEILTLAKERPRLPPGVDRAGLSDIATSYDVKTGTGRIRRVLTRSASNDPESVITWDFESLSNTNRTVRVETSGSKAWSLGTAKTWVANTVPRKNLLSFDKHRNGFTQTLVTQDIPVGKLSVQMSGRTAMVEWNPGPLSKIRRSLAQLETQLRSQSLPDAIGQLHGVDYAVPVSDTTAYLKIDDRWATINPVASDALPDEIFRLRFGRPGVGDASPTLYELRLSAAPDMASEWLAVGQNPLLTGAEAPPADALPLTFKRATDGSIGTMYIRGDQVIFQKSDPLFDLQSGINLFGTEAATRILNVQREMQQTPGTLARGVLASEDVLVLVEPGQLTLVDASHPRFVDLKTAFKMMPAEQLRFQVEQNFIAWVTELNGPLDYYSPQPVRLDDFLKANGVDIDQNPARAPPIGLELTLLEETGLMPSAIGMKTRVQIFKVPLSPEDQIMIHNGVDTVRWNGLNWRVISHGPGVGGAQVDAASTPSPTLQAPEVSHLTLICPETVCILATIDPTPVP